MGCDNGTAYFVYMLRCEDGSIYTGITTDPARRLAQHSGRRAGGAQYTALRRPVRFEAVWTAQGRAAASRAEYALKRLTHAQKELLAAGSFAPPAQLEGCERMGDISDYEKQK